MKDALAEVRARYRDAGIVVAHDDSALLTLTGRVFLAGADPARTSLPEGWTLDEAIAEGVVVSRVEGPTYRLLGGSLVHTRRGPALRLTRPHLVLQLSSHAAEVVAALPGSVADVASRTNLALGRVTTVLADLHARRIVARTPRKLVLARRVSVVIPAYGRPDGTRRTLESVLALAWPCDQLEVLVVDDASPVPLAFPELPAVRVIRQASNQGPAAARNVGLEEASGELVAFLDNDCAAAPDWLTVLAATLEEAEVDVAGGRVLSPSPHGFVAAYESVRSPLDMGSVGGSVGLGKPVPYVPACNLVVRRSAALEMGGFRDGMHLGEDVDFVWRMQAQGRVVYEPAATVVHYHRERLCELLVRRAEYASSEALLVGLHPASRRVLVLPVTVMLALVSLLAPVLALVPLGMTAYEVVTKRARIVALGLPPASVASAVLRAHAASLYHLSATATRYYGLLLLIVATAVPVLRLPVAVLLLTYPLADARVRSSPLPMVLHAVVYTLEMTAYQVGVLWGRVRHRALALPRVELRR